MISFNSLVEGFVINTPEKIKSWLYHIISNEHRKLVGDILIIFMDDASLHQMNKDFLMHDTYTDIITFNKSANEKIISGEIYISIDRIKENATVNEQIFDKELSRVIVHGILHLLGFNDKTKEEKMRMRSKEDYYLNLLP